MSTHTRYVDCALSRLAPACLLSPYLTLVFPMCFQVLSQRFNRARTFVPFHRAPSTVLLASVVDYLPLKWLDRGQRSMRGPIVVAVVGL